MKEIPLTHGKVALVDDEDFDLLSAYEWSYSPLGYAYRCIWQNGKPKRIYMHREIMQTPDGMKTDHKDTDAPDHGLNNQRSNLRVCTQSQNLANRGPNKNNVSGYKGVTWNKATSKWQAGLKVDTKFKNLGQYDDALAAALAYDEAAKAYFGEYAHLNVKE